MDATSINTIVGIIGIIVGIIGAVVGVIGWKQLSAATDIKTKNKNSAKADNGAFVHQDSSITINNGLSSLDTIELAERTAKKTISKVVAPDDFLKLDVSAYSIAPVLCVKPPYSYAFEFFARKGKRCTLKFEKEVHGTNVRCSIVDLDGSNLTLSTQFGSLGVLPQSIYKYLNFKGKGSTEVILAPNQIVAGKTEDGNIILASIEPEHFWICLRIKVALYVPFEVIP